MNKMYVLMKFVIADFDIRVGVPIAVSESANALREKIKELEENLLDNSDISYEIHPIPVKVL